MAARTTNTKRQKERDRAEHQQRKAEKAAARKAAAENRPATEAGVDPDIAGIVPGPQPPREDY